MQHLTQLPGQILFSLPRTSRRTSIPPHRLYCRKHQIRFLSYLFYSIKPCNIIIYNRNHSILECYALELLLIQLKCVQSFILCFFFPWHIEFILLCRPHEILNIVSQIIRKRKINAINCLNILRKSQATYSSCKA